MKACLIIGPTTVMMYKDVYPLLRDKILKVWRRKIHFTANLVGEWFSTFQVDRPDEKKLVLTKIYNENDYPRFDNDPEIIESKSKDIPVDYQGLIAVPITFFKYYDYLPYEILEKRGDLVLNGKRLFARLIIRRKQL